MKKYPEIKGITEMMEFFRFCASLSIHDSQEWDIEDLSTRLNKHYPTNSVHDSHSKNLWQAARDNLDRIMLPKRGRIQRLIYDHPLWSLGGTIVAGVIVSCITIFIIEPWHKNGESTTNTPAKKTSQEIPSSTEAR